jgi:hypothetical protein
VNSTALKKLVVSRTIGDLRTEVSLDMAINELTEAGWEPNAALVQLTEIGSAIAHELHTVKNDVLKVVFNAYFYFA